MALFGFFKKLKDKKVEPEKTEIKIEFSEIENFFEQTEDENRVNEKSVLELVQKEIDNFEERIKDKIKIAQSVDINSKKAEEKFKSITASGREKYIESVENFLQSLAELKKNSLEKFMEDIDKIYSIFSKSSNKNYERATILIGKEIKEINNQVKNLSLKLIEIFKQNKEIIDLYKKISYLRLKLKKVDEIKNSHKKLLNETILLNRRLIESEKNLKSVLEEIEKIKTSKNYLRNIKTKEKIKLIESELNADISGLQKLIDFKKLTSFFHIFEDKMNIVKTYRDSFKESFEKDYGDTLFNLLDESSLNNKNIEEKIRKIREERGEILELKKSLTEEDILKMSEEMERIKSEMNEIKEEVSIKNKIIDRLKTDKEQIENEIKEKLKDLNVVLKNNQ